MDVVTTVEARSSQYSGPFSARAQTSQAVKDILRLGSQWDSLTPSQKESLEMIAHKLARIVSGNASEVDHWRDIGGYAQLIVDEFGPLPPEPTAPAKAEAVAPAVVGVTAWGSGQVTPFQKAAAEAGEAASKAPTDPVKALDLSGIAPLSDNN